MLVSFPLGLLARKPPTLEFLTASSSGAATNYSLTSIPFGTATADRLIVVCVSGHKAATRSISSATIGGVSAIIHQDYTTANSQISIFSAVVPSGTSGTIAINYSGDQADIRYSVFSIKGLRSTTPYLTDQIINTSSDCSSTISPSANSVVIAHGISYSTGTGTTTWSGTAGLTEYSDQVTVNDIHSSAAKVFTAAASNVTVIATMTAGTTEKRMQVIGWK